MTSATEVYEPTGLEIAIIGMAGRFPGAADCARLWDTVLSGQERITRGPATTGRGGPDYVAAWGSLDGVDQFDAAHFGYAPRDAALLDPQQRIFLETAQHAIEDAGYAAGGRTRVGVYAGSSISTYLLRNLLGSAGNAGYGELIVANDKDMLAARVSYHLNLTGPSVAVQTACSTSLVAVHLAGQALLAGECELAIAGGVSVQPPQGGYHPEPGGVLSPSGHCRPFDARADGMVPGSGAAAVVLKPLDDALRDNDTIHAVIAATAVNNDGGDKVGFTAPRVNGQAEMIRTAHRLSGVDPEAIRYVEAHGTATPLGDPIEVAALTRAFRATTPRTGFCALGSVKALIGHLDAAAGVTGLIKTVLALRTGILPPSPYLGEVNPELSLADSPFYIPATARSWPVSGAGPRIAAVSSIGMGGTNAHAILRQAPAAPARPVRRARWHTLPLSARTADALDRMRTRLAGHLAERADTDLADVAFTLQAGRPREPHRAVVVAREPADVASALRTGGAALRQVHTSTRDLPVTFLFPGQGAQRPGMGRGLFDTEPVYRDAIREVDGLARAHDVPLLELLHGEGTDAHGRLTETANAQPALFAVEYALAVLLASWGIRPGAMIGHSVGEYVAACLAGTFSLADAVMLVVTRGALMARLRRGAMLAVALSAADLPRLPDGVWLAADNAPDACVVAGEADPVAAFAGQLSRAGTPNRTLPVSHAFHSPMVRPALPELTAAVADVPAHPPRIPFVSCATGRWITGAEATDPKYWAGQAATTVRFRQGLATVLAQPEQILLEVGPGRALCGFASRAPSSGPPVTALPTLGRGPAPGDEERSLATTLGRLWLAGGTVDWAAYHGPAAGRVPLPGYPFTPTRFWVDAPGTDPRRQAQPPSPPPETDSPDEVTRQLNRIFTDLLGIDRAGGDDDFFELGGTSFLAVRVAARINEEFGVRLSAGDLFDAPTVNTLAALVLRQLTDEERLPAMELLEEIRLLSARDVRAALDEDDRVG